MQVIQHAHELRTLISGLLCWVWMKIDDCRGGETTVSPTKRNRTTSSANYESTPAQVEWPEKSPG